MSKEIFKNCPFCGEEIKPIAIKCRYCKSNLDEKSLLDAKKIKEEVFANNIYMKQAGQPNIDTELCCFPKEKDRRVNIAKKGTNNLSLFVVAACVIALVAFGILCFNAFATDSASNLAKEGIEETQDFNSKNINAKNGEAQSSETDKDISSGTIGSLEIGDRIVDNNWTWTFRHGPNYTIDEFGEINKPVVWIVVGKNHFEVEGNKQHITVLSEEIIANYAFDDSKNRGGHRGSGHWGDSGLPDATHGVRILLNTAFLDAIASSKTFYDAIVTTTLKNDTRFYADYKWGDNWRPYTTTDQVFILSESELGVKSRVNDGYALPYFDLNHLYGPEDSDWLRERRIAYLNNNRICYFTRTPETGRTMSFLIGVQAKYTERTDGNFKGNYAPNLPVGIRPALNLDANLKISKSPTIEGVFEILPD